MQSTRALLQQRQPMIRFLGKRTTPQKVDHTPQVHPASPTQTLPSSFAQYRQTAQQHGPLNTRVSSSSTSGGFIGNKSGAALGSVRPQKGEYFDRNELGDRFKRLPWTAAEIEAIESGGASLHA